MKKRNMLTIMLIAILVFVLGLGTMAYYKKTFSSNENPVRAAKFEVDSNGTLDEDVEFDISEEPIYPGYDNEDVYNFEIDKKGTEVPVKYEIKVSTSGELFAPVTAGNSPVVMTLYRETENGWEAVNSELEINPVENDVEKFKIGLKWNHSDYDIEYQNKSGKIGINVVATQVDGEPIVTSIVNPEPISVVIGEQVTMPGTVVVNMKDGTKKEVPVTWESDVIDTSTPGEKTVLGSVEGFEGKVTLKVIVKAPIITSIGYKERKSQGKLTGYLNLQFEDLPKNAYYQRIIYKTKDGKSKGTYQGIRNSSTSWYSIDLKENIVGQKIDIEICNEGKTETYYTFTDIPLPNPSNN